MTNKLDMLANYLGTPASVMLANTPFNAWPVERSFDNDLEEPIIHYLFPQHGLELRCDCDDKISTIFLYSDKFGGFDESLLSIPFSCTRRQVREHLGPPSKTGGPINDPILGVYGAWDRFTQAEHTIHIQYQADADRVKMITLIRADKVP